MHLSQPVVGEEVVPPELHDGLTVTILDCKVPEHRH